MDINELKKYISEPCWSRGVSISQSGIKKEVRDLLESLTSHLPYQTIASRGWHVENDNYDPQTCLTCGNNVKWDKSYYRYPEYCSNKCIANSDKVKQKKIEVSLEKYGTECSFLNEDLKEKRRLTNIEKFGFEHASQNDDVKSKVKSTNMERRGVEYTLADPNIRKQINDTVKNTYGVDYISQVDSVKEKIKQTSIKNYGVDCPLQSEEIKERIKQTNLEKYGFEYASQSEEIKEKSKQTNIEKYGVESATQKHISQSTLNLLNDKKWLLEQHHTNKSTLTEISNMLDVCYGTVNRKIKHFDIQLKHYNSSSHEKELTSFLDYHNIIFTQNDRTTINPYELDILIPDKNLAIEIHGLYWHSEVFKSTNYHKMKYEVCKSKGIRLLQIFEDEWLTKQDIIKSKLLNILGITSDNAVYARKCNIVEVFKNEREIFLNNNHIQGNGDGSISFGLQYNNELVACMTFIKHTNEYNITRYATSCNVPGGFTKLLKHFEKIYNYPKIITFADLRTSEGKLYNSTGFTVDKILKPDYFWVKRDKRFHKFNFRHKQMKNKLENYDPLLSETENMHNHGFLKLYDCGKIRFIKNQ